MSRCAPLLILMVSMNMIPYALTFTFCRRVPSNTIRHSFTKWPSTSTSSLFSTKPKTIISSDVVKTSAVNYGSKLGGIRRLPVVRAPEELVHKARKAVRSVKPDREMKNVRARARKHGTESLNTLTQALCIPLRDTVNGYKNEWRRLHPFERVVADLTTRARQQKDGLTLNEVLVEIHEARKEILNAGKDWIAKVKNAETAREAGEGLEEGIESLFELFTQLAGPPVGSLLEIQRSLRVVPSVQLDQPAIVLVGSPNVGKSSIVRALSGAKPEVNNYPFTTRGMTLGHIKVVWLTPDEAEGSAYDTPRLADEEGLLDEQSYSFSQLCQIMDSPGLLVRPDEERNEMEQLTLAAMQHLPTAVMYVMDLSGEAGDKCSSIKDQLQLRRDMRARFPRRPWIDVVSKIDLGVDADAQAELEDILQGSPYIQLSLHKGIGIKELRTAVLQALGEVQVVLDAMAAMKKT